MTLTPALITNQAPKPYCVAEKCGSKFVSLSIVGTNGRARITRREFPLVSTITVGSRLSSYQRDGNAVHIPIEIIRDP